MKIPTVGSVVRVTVRDVMGPAMIPPRSGTQTFQGQVVKSPKWVTDREFCITGTDEYPVRVISTAAMLDLEILSGSAKSVDTSIKTWTVTGSRGAEYTVTQTASAIACTCPGFQFRRACKHTKTTVDQ